MRAAIAAWILACATSARAAPPTTWAHVATPHRAAADPCAATCTATLDDATLDDLRARTELVATGCIMKDTGANGQLAVEVSVAPTTGTICQARVVSNDYTSAVLQCVADKVHGFVVSAPSGGCAAARVPVRFVRDGALLVLAMRGDGSLTVGHKRVASDDAVGPPAAALHARDPDSRATIEADVGVPFARIAHVLELLATAGIVRIELTIEPAPTL